MNHLQLGFMGFLEANDGIPHRCLGFSGSPSVSRQMMILVGRKVPHPLNFFTSSLIESDLISKVCHLLLSQDL